MGFIIDLPQRLLEDQSFIEDLARFADGVLTEKQVRQKWHFFEEAQWVALAQSDELVEKIELEKTRRIHSGATKRELAQLHVTKGPAILDGIMTDQKQSARHRIDAIKTLDQLADNGPQSAPEADRFIIRIDLTAGGGEVVEFNKTLKPDPRDDIIDATPAHQELPPPKRGPGRPKGSKNKPKTVDTPQELPLEGGGNEPL
jgi:hypothetical protein